MYNTIDALTLRTEVWSIRPDGSGAQYVPVDLPNPRYPALSRGGERIAVTAGPDGRGTNIFIFTPIGAGLQDVTRFTDIRDQGGKVMETFVPFYKAFSGDGEKLAIITYSRTSRPSFDVSLQISSLDGADLVLVGSSTALRFGGVDWSPTDQVLATPIAVELDSASDTLLEAIVVVDAVADAFGKFRLRLLTNPKATKDKETSQVLTTHDVAPAFCPDGREVAFVRWSWFVPPEGPPGPATSSIQIIGVGGKNRREVMTFPEGEVVSRIGWSPDGTWLVFDRGPEFNDDDGPTRSSDREATALWIIGTDGTGLRELRAAPAFSPAWGRQARICEKDADCDDGNRCTVDRCVDGVCARDSTSGFERADCELSEALATPFCGEEDVPYHIEQAIGAKLEKALALVQRSRDKGKRGRWLLTRAAKSLSAARRRALKAAKTEKITAECRDILGARIAELRRIATDLRTSL